MSGVKDPFEILADEITLIRRQIDQLQRTSLDKTEAKALNAKVVQGLDGMSKVGPAVQDRIENSLLTVAADLRLNAMHAMHAASTAARDAIHEAHRESMEASERLLSAAGEARRQAWRYFGGFWVWLASVGLTGALLGALAVFWLQGRADAHKFGRNPGIFCRSAGGQVVEREDGGSFCAFWIDQPPGQAGTK